MFSITPSYNDNIKKRLVTPDRVHSMKKPSPKLTCMQYTNRGGPHRAVYVAAASLEAVDTVGGHEATGSAAFSPAQTSRPWLQAKGRRPPPVHVQRQRRGDNQACVPESMTPPGKNTLFPWLRWYSPGGILEWSVPLGSSCSWCLGVWGEKCNCWWMPYVLKQHVSWEERRKPWIKVQCWSRRRMDLLWRVLHTTYRTLLIIMFTYKTSHPPWLLLDALLFFFFFFLIN